MDVLRWRCRDDELGQIDRHTPAQRAIRLKGGDGMTERTTKKDNIEDLLLAGRTPAEIAKILGVKRRYAVAVAWRMRNPERERAIKRAVRERLRADPEWLDKERERRRIKHKKLRKNREYRRNRAQTRWRWRIRERQQAQAYAQDDG